MKKKILALFLSFAIICVMQTPGTADAQAPSLAAINNQISQCEQHAVTSEAAFVQKQSTGAQSVFGSMAVIDAAAYVCLDKLEAALNTIEATLSSTNPVRAGAIAAAMAIVTPLILNLINRACQSIQNDLVQIETFALSQINRLCIPLPRLNLNLGIGGLHLPIAQCNGVNLVGPLLGIPPVGSQSGVWNLWNFRAK